LERIKNELWFLGLLLLLSLAKVIHQHVQIDNLKTKFDAEREEIRKDAIKRSRDVLEGRFMSSLLRSLRIGFLTPLMLAFR
jgi:predicted Holliday junction resolvase-like endonuclease